MSKKKKEKKKKEQKQSIPWYSVPEDYRGRSISFALDGSPKDFMLGFPHNAAYMSYVLVDRHKKNHRYTARFYDHQRCPIGEDAVPKTMTKERFQAYLDANFEKVA